MTLEFQLLIVDDDPEFITEAVTSLEEHLESKGFTLGRHNANDFSEKALRELARTKGRDYNLVMVDYRLGREDTDGAIAADHLRANMRYTDMVFYSSDPSIDLYDQLAKKKVSGVFVVNRSELDEALIGLADTLIGKVVDLNHMRGIAMAEVAELDVLMEETLVRAFKSAEARFGKAKERTAYRLREGVASTSKELEQVLESGDLAAAVKNGRLFSSYQKFMTIKRVASSLREKPTTALRVLALYESEINAKRNLLAHAKANKSEDGKTILRSMDRNSEVIIDDNWMDDFRIDLKKHSRALSTVCGAISSFTGLGDTRQGAGEPQ